MKRELKAIGKNLLNHMFTYVLLICLIVLVMIGLHAAQTQSEHLQHQINHSTITRTQQQVIKSKISDSNIKLTNQERTPTIFVHGWRSSLKAELPLAHMLINHHQAASGLIVRVRPDSQILIKGSLKNKLHPNILIRFENNMAGEKQDIVWLHEVMAILKKHYHVNDYNAIGHSMGAYTLVGYNSYYGNQKDLPKLHKLILLAGPYDGILDEYKSDQPLNRIGRLWDDAVNQNSLMPNGCPKIIHPEYRWLEKYRYNFPKQAQVLNVFGDLQDGTDSDGTVSVASARSLRYLLASHVKEYEEMEAIDYYGRHQRLHSYNPQIDQSIDQFLNYK